MSARQTRHCSRAATARPSARAARPRVSLLRRPPATSSSRLDELERERHFGAHQHERPQLRVGADLVGEKDHRRNADAAAEREQPRPRRIEREAVADRREHAEHLAGCGAPSSLSSP